MNRKKIAIAMGGYSSEHEISLQSGDLVYQHLDREKYEVYRLHIFKAKWYVLTEDGQKFSLNKREFSTDIKGKRVEFDCVFNIIHGPPGENGILQAYLETLGIPQTASNFYPAALTFNKRDCISVIQDYGFKTAKNHRLRKGESIDEDAILKKIGLPCFVKANRGGSSFGVSKVKEKPELQKAIAHSFNQDDEVIIESFLEGTEVDVGIIHYQNKVQVLPVTEIVPQNEFFDYRAKYFGESQEITPARISEGQTRAVQNQAKQIFELLNLKGFVRVEFIFHHGEPHFLEVNTCPGISPASIVPQQLEAAGISPKEFFTDVVERAISEFR